MWISRCAPNQCEQCAVAALAEEVRTKVLGLAIRPVPYEPEQKCVQSPANVRELAATWDRVLPHLHRLRGPFADHAAVSDGWISNFDAFADLLTQWGDVLAEAARRRWRGVGVSE